jgi:hypothetical protein
MLPNVYKLTPVSYKHVYTCVRVHVIVCVPRITCTCTVSLWAPCKLHIAARYIHVHVQRTVHTKYECATGSNNQLSG